MAYACPKCGKKVQRGVSEKAQKTAGLVGLLFQSAFAPFNCPECGKIKRSEFPPEVRMKMNLLSFVLFASAIALAVVVILILANT